MKRNLIIPLMFLSFLMLGQGVAPAAQEIVAVQSVGIQPYEEALNGFRSVRNDKIRRLIISELKGASVADRIDEIRADMVLAIGIDALTAMVRR